MNMKKLELVDSNMELLLVIVHNYIQRSLGGEETVMNPKNIDQAAWVLRIYRKIVILTNNKFSM